MTGLEISISEFTVVRTVATTDAGGLDSNLELIGRWIGYGSRFLDAWLATRSTASVTGPPRACGKCGMDAGREGKAQYTRRKSLGPCKTDAWMVVALLLCLTGTG